MSDLMAKLKKNSTVKATTSLDKSTLFNKKDMSPTQVPILNVALSGSMDGGLTSGLTVVAGPSKHYKSNLALLMASGYMKKYPEAIMLFYDSEFGITDDYLKSFNIDPSRILHTPIVHVEQLKFDISKQLDELDRGDKVVLLIDSIGNLASKKEMEDALSEKSVADMTRAKALKGLFRIITPYLTTKDLPMIAINHTYDEIGLFPKKIMGGGTGIYYSANNIFFMGRQQEKDGKQIAGYNFMCKVEKSRFVKEGTNLPINVMFDKGINKWSGLLEIALELGYVIKPKNGWYQGVSPEIDKTTGELTHKQLHINPKNDEPKSWRAKDTMCSEFWKPMLSSGFNKAVEERFKLSASGFTSELEPEDMEYKEVDLTDSNLDEQPEN